ncbi:MAG: TIGR03960 family B12-binding radical SAM protein [Desulfovermiculus sp.]|nr:TIGR03960 family B12-binding radical SAM protein [Desulfovermiculus sp.]
MPQTHLHPLLPLLPRPSHFLGTEFNSVTKALDRVSLRWGLAFPDLYEVGMSHLGLKILYHILNNDSRIWAERVFAPSREASRIMRDQQSVLCTLESHTPLNELDILGFSLTHELCYTTVLYMLDLAGIPLRSTQRDANHPLVVAGGGACVNPEPMAPFFDLLVIGDGEEVVLELSRIVLWAKQAEAYREDLLVQVQNIPGIYVPSHFSTSGQGPLSSSSKTKGVEKRVLVDLNTAFFPTGQIVPFGQAVHDRFTVEIARGCTRGCRFCQAGMTMRPVRERSLSQLDELLQNGLNCTGFEELSFLSLSTGDFSQLEALFAQSLARCREEQVAISLPSLRVGSINPGLMHSMASLRRTGATLAPEAGSQRLRNVINKGITEEALLQHAHDLFASGWKRLKLYFMIGLPTETEQDLQAIHDLCLKVLDTAGTEKKKIQLTASIALFVPKPHTPFQWVAQDDIHTASRKIAYLQDLFRRPKNLILRWHDPYMSAIEGVFSRGDRSLARIVEKAYAQGDILTSWQEHFHFSLWEQVLAENQTDIATWIRARDHNEVLPWSHINCGIRSGFLVKEWEKALQEAVTPDCRYHSCSRCGVCTLGREPGELAEQACVRPILPLVNQDRRDQEKEQLPEIGSLSEPGWEQKAENLVLRFEKKGPAAYLSQLELQTVFERLFRRAGLPLSFSRGFHPMPRLSFGRALPVGVHSEDETCIVGLRRSLGGDMCARLNPYSVAGLVFTQAQREKPGYKLGQPRYEHFQLVFHRLQSEQEVERWKDFNRALDWTVDRRTKKGIRRVDLRSRVHRISIHSPDRVHLIFDWEPGYLSPLFFVRTLHPDLDPRDYTLTKIKSPEHE